MNPVVVPQLLAAIVTIAISVPLILRKVKMNHWYGVRIPAAFESEEAWFDINRYGGRLLLLWGVAMAVTAAVGVLPEREDWVFYDWAALAINMAGLAVVLAKVYRYAQTRNRV